MTRDQLDRLLASASPPALAEFISEPDPRLGVGGNFPPSNISPEPATLADDLLRGAAAIGAFIGELPKRVFYLAAKGQLPIGREGMMLIASKKVLRDHYARLTSSLPRTDKALGSPPTPAQSGRRRSVKTPAPRRDRRQRRTADPQAADAAPAQ
jgi:hypothetical protein